MNKSENTNPVFSGNQEDLNDFVTMILKDMTTEQLAYYCVENFATENVTTASGYVLPVSGAVDALSGVDTDLPLTIHMGETWNKELSRQVGDVIGTERRGQKTVDSGDTLAFSAVADVRINPLSGRYNEGFSEDPHLTSELCDSMGNGLVGDDDLYILTQSATKHYSTYNAEWDRTDKTNFCSARALYEYQLPGFYKAVENNHINGIMTSFGATNGVPNVFSDVQRILRNKSRYSLFSISDYNNDAYMLSGIGNGYDTSYCKTNAHVAAMMILGGPLSNNLEEDVIGVDDYVTAVENGLFGLTKEDLEEHLRPQVELWVRSGYFNQSAYPYADIAADGTPLTSADSRHQEVAYNAAQEGIVLLKNEHDILPLSSSGGTLITGPFADIRIQPGYTTTTPTGIENAGLTPLEALENELSAGGGSCTYVPEASGTRIVLKSTSNGKYLAISDDNTVYASADDQSDAAVFQIYDWGLDAHSFLCLETNQFLSVSDDTIVMSDNTKIDLPVIFTYETTEDGQIYMRYGALISSPFQQIDSGIPFYEYFTTQGYFLEVDGDSGQLILGASTTDGYTDSDLFAATVIGEAGIVQANVTQAADYALVFIGSLGQINAGETTDRPNMNLGDDQLKLVKNISASCPGKTIVIVKTEYPLALEELKKNDNIAAIVYMSYAGQYDSYALANTILGHDAPSGRLSATWLKDLSTLPILEDADGIDPRYRIDMKNADIIQTRLTYQYNDADSITYPFGYGLSYTTFETNNVTVTTNGNDNSITLTAEVTNIGSSSGKEVIQVYMSSMNSVYAPYVPDKQLVAFTKTALLAPGETESITLTIESSTYAKWDVAAADYIVETGDYEIALGSSAEEIFWTTILSVEGESLGTTDLSSARNVWNSVYGSYEMLAAEVSKARTLAYEGNYYAVESKQDGSYVVIPNVDFEGKTPVQISAASTNATSTVDLYAGTMDSEAIAQLTFSATSPVTYNLDGESTLSVTELGYVNVSAQLKTEISSIEDLYLVFRSSGIRIDSIQLK